MVMIPKTVKELRDYLDTFPDDKLVLMNASIKNNMDYIYTFSVEEAYIEGIRPLVIFPLLWLQEGDIKKLT